jgi:hypothetical protein
LAADPRRRYAQIAAACDALLRDDRRHESWLASPLLHVISGHPTTWCAYDGIGDDRPSPRERGPAALRHVANVVRGFRAAPVPRVEPAEVVLVGGLVDAAHLDAPGDFYFGDLQRELAARGVRSLLVLRNQTGERSSRLIERARRHGAAARLLLPSLLSATDELGLWRFARAGARRMRELELPQTAIERDVRARAVRDVASASTTGNLRLERAVTHIVRETGARVVVAMYEGHSWERCVWRAARRASPRVRCVAYQHTILRSSSHAVRRQVGGSADPDTIVCLGYVTRDDLAAAPELHATTFDVLGTHRRAASAGVAPAPRTDDASLVLPEGLPDEVRLMFDFALRAAAIMPQTHFILRSHPILPPEPILAELLGGASAPANVELSTGRTLDDDLQRSGSLLYRGSSTALYGILAGVKPFYLARSGELGIDPLYQLQVWRGEVTTADEFARLWTADLALPADVRFGAWAQAAEFADRYTVSPQPAAIDRLGRMAMGEAQPGVGPAFPVER